MSETKALAFYLPQYHAIKENSEWWGPGFTEWTNVAKAKPNFDGHYQPHIPRDLGFYDLSQIENMRAQVDMARLYGIYGFCFYYYWFNGRRILELPLNNYLKSDIDFPFCVCWANENWTRTWDGNKDDVLLGQFHSEEEDERFIEDLIPLLKDRRSIKVNGKPMVLVYRASLFPDAKKTVATWRKIAEKHGLEGLHLCAVQFYGITDPSEFGFDAAVEFPPHTYIGSDNSPNVFPRITNPDFKGGIIDYRKIISQSMAKDPVSYIRYRGIIPSWDNTARRQDTPHAIIDSSPDLYELWLTFLVAQSFRENRTDDFIFINAWNEWGEGAHLEPDLKYGHQYLEATARALNGVDNYSKPLVKSLESVLEVIKPGFLSEMARETRELRKMITAYESDIKELRMSSAVRNNKLFINRISCFLSSTPRFHAFARKIHQLIK